MSIFKCKMCGGTLDIKENETVATCEYCGTRQTIPRLDRERKIALYDRADHFRRNKEFDKAIAIYEQVLNEDTTDAESYWSLVLCRYGIEYVEDPAIHKRVPTVNRTQFTSIFDDENYKAAIQYADANQRILYEEEAATINEIQKSILEISQREKPFDIFICYKETDNEGRRTLDSVLATDLYHQLTKEGYKVFFSRITLEDKLGTAYEPYIFAALNSAKVMVVIGTKSEYFNAPWVKNEWSRYLAIVKQSHGEKVLIPAYRDMNPYDLPEEFAHLQAQDMSKLGFMQDLIRGVKKIVHPTTINSENVVSKTDVKPLLERAGIFLEDGDFDKADEYYEKVLDIVPKNVEAYVGKLLAELKLKKRSELAECVEPFDGSSNYEKALRYADDELKSELAGYIDHINIKNENARKREIYDKAKRMIDSTKKSGEYIKAADLLQSISEYEDAAILADICKDKAEEAKKKRAKKNKMVVTFSAATACIVVAVVLVVINVIIPVSKYNNAIELVEAGKYWEAYGVFTALGDYKDSTEQLELVKTEMLKTSTPGDYVVFGAYEQDNDESNGKEPIEWLILDSRDNKKLLISRYALDAKQYNEVRPKATETEEIVDEDGFSYENVKEIDVTWGTSSVHKWLNEDFINMAFTENEKSVIPEVTVVAENAPETSIEPGVNTKDKVFLLSYAEAEKYFESEKERICKSTAYAVAQGAQSGLAWWWLRSMSEDSGYFYVYSACCVEPTGELSGMDVVRTDYAVRPAIWVNI